MPSHMKARPHRIPHHSAARQGGESHAIPPLVSCRCRHKSGIRQLNPAVAVRPDVQVGVMPTPFSLHEGSHLGRERIIIDGSFVEVPRQRKRRSGVDRTSVRVLGRVYARNVQPSGRLCAERGFQHLDNPGLQPRPLRASHATRNRLTH